MAYEELKGQELPLGEKHKGGDKEMHKKSEEVLRSWNWQELQRKRECGSVHTGSRMKTRAWARGGRANVKRIGGARKGAGI